MGKRIREKRNILKLKIKNTMKTIIKTFIISIIYVWIFISLMIGTPFLKWSLFHKEMYDLSGSLYYQINDSIKVVFEKDTLLNGRFNEYVAYCYKTKIGYTLQSIHYTKFGMLAYIQKESQLGLREYKLRRYNKRTY